MTLQLFGRQLGTVKLSRIPLGPCAALVWHLQDGGDRVQLSSGNKALFQFGFKWFIQWLTSDLGLINFIFCEWRKLLQRALCEHNFLCITWTCARHQWLPCMYWVWGLWCIYMLLFQGYRKTWFGDSVKERCGKNYNSWLTKGNNDKELCYDTSKFCKKQVKLFHTNCHNKMVCLFPLQDLGKFLLSVIKLGFM